MTALVGLFTEAWAWWLREFLGLLPAAERAYARLPFHLYLPQRHYVLLRAHAAETELSVVKAGVPEWRAALAHPASGAEAAELRSAMHAKYRGLSGSATVLLPHESVLEAKLPLPRAAAQHLEEAASYQIERLSPFPPANTLYALGGATGDAQGEAIEVQIFIAAKDLVEEAGERAKALGFSTIAFAVETAGPGGFERIAFAGHKAGSRGLSLGTRVSLASWVLLAATLLLAPIVSKTLALARVETEIARLKPAAEQAIKLKSAREKEFGILSKAIELRRAAPPPLSVLNTLAEALGDGSFLVELRLEGRALTLLGLSEDASALAQKLGSVPDFKAVKFLGAVTHDARAGRDRFTLTLELANPS